MRKLLAALLLCCCHPARAQFTRPVFHTLGIKAGLPEAFIKRVLQDRNGYLWLGTQNGLVRFDGYTIRPYPMRDAAGRPVIVNAVVNLQQDGNGIIWAYTYNDGIFRYQPQADQFSQVVFDFITTEKIKNCDYMVFDDAAHHTQWIGLRNLVSGKQMLYRFDTDRRTLTEFSSAATGRQQVSISNITGALMDAKGSLWLAGDSLICYFDQARQQFKTHYVLSAAGLKGKSILQMVADPADASILWLNTYDGTDLRNFQPHLVGNTVLRLNTATKAVQRFSVNAAEPSALSAGCFGIAGDSLKRMWLITKNGVSLYNESRNNFTNYAGPFGQDCACAYAVCADAGGNVWIGVRAGLFYLNVKTGESQKAESNTYAGSLPALLNGISGLFYDRSGTLWVNMPWAGIAYLDKQQSLFAPVPLRPDGAPATGRQWHLVGHEGDSICYISDTANLYAWNTISNRYTRIEVKDRAAFKLMTRVVRGSDGSYWIGSGREGLFNYNPKTGAWRRWKHNPTDSSSIPDNNVESLALGHDGTLWVGTWGEGLYSCNPQTGRFTKYPYVKGGITNPGNALDDNEVVVVTVDRKGTVWIGANNGGLNSFDPATQKFKTYLDTKQGFACVNSILEDHQNRLWAGTYLTGLYLIDRQKGNVKHYSEADGLIHNGVLALTEDSLGHIWCGTVRGYSRLNPANGSIVSYPISDVSSRNIDNNIFYQDARGFIYQSFKDGMVRFNPADLRPNLIPPSVVIETLRYKAASTGKDTVRYAPATQEISLRYNENKIDFQFVALHFANASQNTYAYRLAGYDKDWVAAGTHRTATYTNLSEGTYTFKVKAANSDGVWNETGTSLTIIILPPWWRTWWAYSLYVLLAGGGVWWYVRHRSKALRKENLSLENTIEQRTADLRRQKEIAEKERTRAEQSERFRQQFLANMSHEIRTPMNAVMGMTRLLIEKSPRPDQFPYLDGINKSSDNLLHIINDILDLSKIEAGKMELEAIDFSLRALVEQVRQTLGFKAAEKGLELFSEIAAALPDVWIGDPTRLGQVLLNLAGNAIKFTEKGSVDIQIAQSPPQGSIHFAVIDTGIGIPADKLQAVFESFTQANASDTRKHGGTGLGLSISRQLVEMMGGALSIESEEGAGTTFSFTLALPAGSAEKLEAQNLSQQIDGSILNGLSILVVDDNEYNRIVVHDTLMLTSDVAITQATNGLEAVDAVAQHDFDVVLMDVQMPVMNGFEATQHIRNQFSAPKNATPVIALTASVIRSDLDKCRAAGMNDYLPKPFKTAELISALAKAAKREIRYVAKKESHTFDAPQHEPARVTNLSYLEKFCQGDRQQMQKYIRMFAESAPALIQKLGTALASNDFEEIAAQVHGYKTKWIMMGMAEAKTLAAHIERQCREAHPDEAVKQQVCRLIAQIEAAQSELT